MNSLRAARAWSPRCLALAALLLAGPLHAGERAAALKPCRLVGVEQGALCGVLQRPLDPALPAGRQIDLHYAVLPALARQRKPDPVFFFAGGPGQSAIELAGPLSRLLARLQNRRDVVLIDQRGTGRSAPLQCADESPARPLTEQVEPARQRMLIDACRRTLQALPHGDLRHYTTTIAMQDADAVRRELGAARINLVGASYGTRAVLEYMRQFPAAVRRAVIDGAAPPDMVLPASFSADAQAAFDALLRSCEADASCAARYPALRSRWQALLLSLPLEATLPHPVTNVEERVLLTRDIVTGLVRQALYAPALASALPAALEAAAEGRFAPLFGLASALGGGGRRAGQLARGMHFSVVCAEDVPRLDGSAERPGADFGTSFAELYQKVCADWPRGEVPADFYRIGRAPAATLVLSGGIDPATPPRHGERVARALGPLARDVMVANAGHGVLSLPCHRDLLFRFIDAASDGEALQVDASCAAAVPRPPPFVAVVAKPVEATR